MALRDFFTVLRARWALVVVATVLGGLLALTLSILTTPSYQSRIQFYVTVSGGDSAAAAYQGSLGAQQRVQSYAALVTSTDVADDVVQQADVDRSAEEVAGSTTASADANKVLLEVASTDPDPEVAFRIAQAYGDVLPNVIRALETPEGGGPALAKLSVVNPPAVASQPIAPRTVQNVALGALAGLAIGVIIALLSNALDRRIKSKDQIEGLSGAPIVGSIPFRRSQDKDPDAEHIVPFREGHSPAAEAFRRLRTNLQFLRVDNPPHVFVLTSSVASEGKSETAVNLSLALAEAGHRVLVIEADLRRPRVVNYMAMPDKVGLTNVLAGQARFEDVVQSTRHSRVDLLACGPLPPNPSELLSSEMAEYLFDELRPLYDYVVIDSPPLLPVTDGAILARITDGAFLVARSDRTTTDQLQQAVDNLKKADAVLLGVITVASKPSRVGRSSYYDSYYYESSQIRPKTNV